MPTFTEANWPDILSLPRVDVSDQPFRPQIETILDLPVPPSVNSTRRVNYGFMGKYKKWKQGANACLLASGQLKWALRNIPRFELHITLDDHKCRLDADNGVKAICDYLKHLNIIVDDGKKHLRKLTVEWGSAPQGCRVAVKPLEAA